MQAITLWQPWATLIALGVKTFETRSWAFPDHLVGQQIAIHAAKRAPTADEQDVGRFRCAKHHGKWHVFDTEGDTTMIRLPLGAVVARTVLASPPALIVDPDSESLGPPHVVVDGDTLLHRPLPQSADPIDVSADLPYGDFTPSRFAWPLAYTEPVDPPITAAGAQQFWTLPDDVEGEIIRRLIDP